MDTITLIGEILKYVLPAALVLVGIRMVQMNQEKKVEAEHKLKLRTDVMRDHLPLKLAAYERAVLFLERISPEHLLMRETGVGMNTAQYRSSLIKDIRQEFEHNLAQQIYIHPQAWDGLIEAKNYAIQSILEESEQLSPESKGQELASRLLNRYSKLENSPIRNAILMLKSDIGQYFLV
ncbi:MAG: hypothetical protein AAFY71_11985 [Bacteroidota bacterium]